MNEHCELCNLSDILPRFFFKAVTLRMDCVLAGTSLTRMTSTGRFVRDQRGPTGQVLPLGMAVMVSLLYI